MECPLGDPEEKHQDEDGHGLDFLAADFTHSVELFLQALQSTFYLRFLFLLFHREEDVHTQQKTDDKYDQAHRPTGLKPIRIAEVAGAQETGYERNCKQVGAGAGVEGIGSDIHLEQVLKHEVSSEIVPVSIRCSIDGAHYHKDRQHYGRLHCGGGDKEAEDEVDKHKAPKYSLGRFTEFDHEGEGQAFCEFGLYQHTGQNEAQDV